jgi:lipopolysaccharide biosynthesis protein
LFDNDLTYGGNVIDKLLARKIYDFLAIFDELANDNRTLYSPVIEQFLFVDQQLKRLV